MDLEQSEKVKINFVQNSKPLKDNDVSIEILQKIIFARTEEILELCVKSLESNSFISGKPKMVLMGEGSKILDNKHKDKISFSNDIDFLEETKENICQSGFKLSIGLNKNEVFENMSGSRVKNVCYREQTTNKNLRQKGFKKRSFYKF